MFRLCFKGNQDENGNHSDGKSTTRTTSRAHEPGQIAGATAQSRLAGADSLQRSEQGLSPALHVLEVSCVSENVGTASPFETASTAATSKQTDIVATGPSLNSRPSIPPALIGLGLTPSTSAASSLTPDPGHVNQHMNGQAAAAYTEHALGPNIPAATTSVRPEELFMLQPLDNMGMGLLARPASLQLHQLNREITNLQKIGQGAGGIVYRGLWTGVNVAIKFLKSSSPDQLNQTAKEAILSRFVSHPNVVQTYTYDVTLLVDSVIGVHGGQQQQPGALHSAIMPGILEEDHPDPVVQSVLEPGGTSPTAEAADAAPKAEPGVTASHIHGPPPPATAQQQQPNLTTTSLAIFDRSTMDVHASMVSQQEGESMMGWDMEDVLLRLGAETGQYLTHIIMELCDAGTLQVAITQGAFSGSKESSEERAKCRTLLKTVREIAGGMQHLHSLGIIHGDLKPGNVLLKKDASSKSGFIAKVGDFGLAQRCVPGAPEVQHGVPLGTLCYAAPEALRGTLLKNSDVYSFGVMLWQMCSGKQPFHGMHPATILYGKQTGTLKLAWPPEVYSPIRKLGELCTEPEPAARPNFDQVCKALVQIEQRLKRTKGPPISMAASVLGSGPRAVVSVEQPHQGLMYSLMPDPELL